jgi:Putative prokaryotic signal transducing protein
MKTIYSTFNPADAQLVWSQLDAAGFGAEVSNEASALSLEGYALAVGGIDVRVPDDRVEEALAFLKAEPGVEGA